MKKAKFITVLALSLTMMASQSAAAFTDGGSGEGTPKTPVAKVVSEKRETAAELMKGGKYVKNELLVTYDDDMSDRKIKRAVNSDSGKCEDIFEATADTKTAVVRVAAGQTMKNTMGKFLQDGRVLAVQPNYRYRIRSEENKDDENFTKSDRPYYQYFINAVKAREAWKKLGNKPAARTRVAVIDTGVDSKHEDLQANLLLQNGKYKAFYNGNETEATGDTGNHGTHVTGIIGATYGNGKGGFGIASGPGNNLSEIMVVGSSADGEYLTTADIISSINHAASKGAKVMNMSFGDARRDRLMGKAIKDGYYNKGITFVAASGNNNTDDYGEPEGLKEVISVAGSNRNGERWTFGSMGGSNYSNSVDISAPGEGVMSTVPGNRYERFTGTSMASPAVAAVAALMLDANPALTPRQVKNIMCASNGTPFNQYTGYGLVDAEKCVENTQKAKEDPAAVESVEMKVKEASVYEDDDVSIDALVRPATNLTNITWSSSDGKIAQVDDNGTVTGIAAGTATITASAGSKSVSCVVKVKPAVKAEKIEIVPNSIPKDGEVGVNEMLTLKARIYPQNATNKEIYWKVEKPDGKALTVDDDGNVEGVKPGVAKITAYTFAKPAEGTKLGEAARKISHTITMKVKEFPKGIKIYSSPSWLMKGKKGKISAKIKDFKGTSDSELVAHYGIKYISNNSQVAKVDEKTGRITAVKPGVAYLSAEYNYIDKFEEAHRFYDRRKIIISKKNYRGKRDYRLKRAGKKRSAKVKLTWKRIPIASGYILKRAASAKGRYKQLKKIKSGSRTRYAFKAGRKGFYKVRAYCKVNRKTMYFGYSNIVRVAAKK